MEVIAIREGYAEARVPGVLLDFFAEASDKNVNGTRSHKRTLLPHCAEELIPGKHAPAMPRQVLEEPKLPHGGHHRPALHTHRHRADVNLQISDLDHFMRGDIRPAAQRIADPHDQLPGAERLRDISIAANLECVNTIGFLSSGGKEHDRDPCKLFILANLAAQVEAVDSWQHDVQQKQSWLRGHGRRNHRRPRKESGDLIPGHAEVVFDEAGNIQIVFHDHQRLAAGQPPARLDHRPEEDVISAVFRGTGFVTSTAYLIQEVN